MTSFLNGDQNYHSRFLSSISIRQELTEEILLKISTLLNDLEYWATRRLAKKVEL